MKKTILFLMLISAFNVMSATAESFFPPEWNEFCPSRYIYIHPEKKYILNEKKYWQQRKINFEKKVGYCKTLPSSKKEDCYKEVRLMENNATEVQLKQDENDSIKTLRNYGKY